MQPDPQTARWLAPEELEAVCDAYGKGFDQSDRDLPNPYKGDSLEWNAWEYGRQRGKQS